MDCTTAKELIDRSTDDRTPLDATAREHVDACAECRRYLEETTALGTRLADEARAIVESTPSNKVDDVIAALESRPSGASRTRTRRILVAVACAAAILLVLGGARRRARKGKIDVAERRRELAAKFTPEQREALRLLEKARQQAIAGLARPATVRTAPGDEYGRQYVDVPLASEMDGLGASLRSAESFLLECLPMPALEAEGSSRSPGRGVRPLS